MEVGGAHYKLQKKFETTLYLAIMFKINIQGVACCQKLLYIQFPLFRTVGVKQISFSLTLDVDGNDNDKQIDKLPRSKFVRSIKRTVMCYTT